MEQDMPQIRAEPKLQVAPEQTEVQSKEDDGPRAISSDEEGTTTATTKKPLSFYLAFWGLNVMSLVCSLDATTLAVAIPVSSDHTTLFMCL